MGWQDILAKHHPIPAFFAAVISNIITGNKAGENPTDTNFYNEPSSSDDYTYGRSDIQPAQYYYPPTPIPSSSSLNEPKKINNKTYNAGHQIDHYNTTNNEQYYYPSTPIVSSSFPNKPKKNKNKTYDEGHRIDYYNTTNNEQIVKSKGFWKRKIEHVVEKRKVYGSEKGTMTRAYCNWNGEEVVEERDYQLQSYYELQLSPAKVVETGKKDDYQGAGRTRYYEG